MNCEAAQTYAARMDSANVGKRVRVSVPLNTGTHHTVVLLERGSNGEYKESWRARYPSRLSVVEMDAKAGDIVYQRTTSPASADVLERYGVVRGDRDVDWGVDADWVVDFGPMGDVTRRGLRSPSASRDARRDRTTTARGKQDVVGGAVQEAGSTTHASG